MTGRAPASGSIAAVLDFGAHGASKSSLSMSRDPLVAGRGLDTVDAGLFGFGRYEALPSPLEPCEANTS